MVPICDGSSVTESDELIGRSNLLSRLPQYLITAIFDAHVAVATCVFAQHMEEGFSSPTLYTLRCSEPKHVRHKCKVLSTEFGFCKASASTGNSSSKTKF